jgi:hypothetical protein
MMRIKKIGERAKAVAIYKGNEIDRYYLLFILWASTDKIIRKV